MKKTIIHLLPIFLFMLISPIVLLAAETKPDFVPLVGIPGIDADTLSTTAYINALYILAMSVAAFIAVVRLIMAGLKYIMSDVVTNKESAKKDIKNSLIGLLIVFGAVLILETINPQLKRLDFLRNAPASELVMQKYQTGGATEKAAPQNSVINLETRSQTEIDDYIADCIKDGNYQYSTTIIQGVRYGECTPLDTLKDGRELNTPDEIRSFQESCWRQQKEYRSTELPSGAIYGSCQVCNSISNFSPSQKKCLPKSVPPPDTIDDVGSEDVTFDESGTPTLQPRIQPGHELQFTCLDYEDNKAAFNACSKYCFENGGGQLGPGLVCIGATAPATDDINYFTYELDCMIAGGCTYQNQYYLRTDICDNRNGEASYHPTRIGWGICYIPNNTQ